MRILAFSDLCWLGPGRRTTVDQLRDFVDSVCPDLVLLAGDLVDDFKSSEFRFNEKRSTYWRELIKFLNFLEAQNLKCLIVKGNWDEVPEYDEIAAQNYTRIKDVSSLIIEDNQTRILGIPHDFTSKTSTMRGIHDLCPEPVDIVLTHADGTRRIWLFELPAKLIITGHTDTMFCLVRDKVFLSFSSFPAHYAVIEYQPHDIGITYASSPFQRSDAKPQRYEARIVNGKAIWANNPRREWIQYAKHMEALLDLKEKETSLTLVEKRDAIQELLRQGVYKAHILQYISGAYGILK